MSEYNALEDNPNGIPRIWEAFSSLRAISEDLFTIVESQPEGTPMRGKLNWIAEELRDIGAMDEPLLLLINGALDGTNTESNTRLLKYLAAVE